MVSKLFKTVGTVLIVLLCVTAIAAGIIALIYFGSKDNNTVAQNGKQNPDTTTTIDDGSNKNDENQNKTDEETKPGDTENQQGNEGEQGGDNNGNENQQGEQGNEGQGTEQGGETTDPVDPQEPVVNPVEENGIEKFVNDESLSEELRAAVAEYVTDVENALNKLKEVVIAELQAGKDVPNELCELVGVNKADYPQNTEQPNEQGNEGEQGGETTDPVVDPVDPQDPVVDPVDPVDPQDPVVDPVDPVEEDFEGFADKIIFDEATNRYLLRFNCDEMGDDVNKVFVALYGKSPITSSCDIVEIDGKRYINLSSSSMIVGAIQGRVNTGKKFTFKANFVVKNGYSYKTVIIDEREFTPATDIVTIKKEVVVDPSALNIGEIVKVKDANGKSVYVMRVENCNLNTAVVGDANKIRLDVFTAQGGTIAGMTDYYVAQIRTDLYGYENGEYNYIQLSEGVQRAFEQHIGEELVIRVQFNRQTVTKTYTIAE